MRQFLEKSGCSVIIPVAIAGVLIFGISYNSCAKPDITKQYNQEYSQSIIAKIGNHDIRTQDVMMLINSMNKDKKRSNIVDEINLYGQACHASITRQIMVYLAENKKLDLSDTKILEFFEHDMKEKIDSVKQQLISAGKLKAEASEKEFNDVFKKEVKQDIHNLVDKQQKEIKEALKNKEKREYVVASFVPQMLIKNITDQIKVTEDEIKSQFNQLTAQKIEFTKNKDKNIIKAKEALMALREGKPLDQVRKEFGADTPQKGREELNLPMQFIGFIPDLAPLAKLKVGEYTEVITHGKTASIYKLVKIAPSLPPDYLKNIASYRKRFIAQKANEQIKKEVESIEKSSKLEWLSKAYRANYDFNKFIESSDRQAQIDKEALRQKYLSFAKQAEIALGDMSGSFIAKGTNYLALQSAIQLSNPQQIKELYDQRVRAIQNLLQNADDTRILLELTNLYLEKKNKDTGETLVAAAESLKDVTEEGNSQHQQIDQLTKKLQTEKLLSEKQLEKIEKENTRWKRERKQYEEAKAKQNQAETPMPNKTASPKIEKSVNSTPKN